jgi:hypothetical protein
VPPCRPAALLPHYSPKRACRSDSGDPRLCLGHLVHLVASIHGRGGQSDHHLLLLLLISFLFLFLLLLLLLFLLGVFFLFFLFLFLVLFVLLFFFLYSCGFFAVSVGLVWSKQDALSVQLLACCTTPHSFTSLRMCWQGALLLTFAPSR